jgi:hypothetical protein
MIINDEAMAPMVTAIENGTFCILEVASVIAAALLPGSRNKTKLRQVALDRHAKREIGLETASITRIL